VKEYVLGFAFDAEDEKVVLILKQKPDWQKGRFNGIGGKIEPGETPHEAMAREFTEETGKKSSPAEWMKFGVMKEDIDSDKSSDDSALIYVFTTILFDTKECKTVTEEEVKRFHADYLPTNKIDNLLWLIPAAMYHILNTNFKIEATYS